MDYERLDRIERKINRIGTLAIVTAGLVFAAIVIAPFVWFGSRSISIGDIDLIAVAAAVVVVFVIAGALWLYWRPFRD